MRQMQYNEKARQKAGFNFFDWLHSHIAKRLYQVLHCKYTVFRIKMN